MIIQKFDRRMVTAFDWWLFIAMTCLVIIGVLSIANAAASPITQENMSLTEIIASQEFYYARLQITSFFIGLVALGLVLAFRYQFYNNIWLLIYWITIAVLVFVLFSERARGNMAGWFRVGVRSLQPSEFAKLTLIISMAKLFSRQEKPPSTIKELLPILGYFALPTVLIALQPDYGTALVYIFIFGCILFASGTSFKLLLYMLGFGILALILAWGIISASENFRLDRILVFFNSAEVSADTAMQSNHAKIALGSGMIYGKGLFSVASMGQLGFIPDDHTDMVFAITGETFGFIGSVAVVLLYAFIFVRMIYLSSQMSDRFASLIIIGIAAMFLFHTFENIGMVIGLMPITGIPLPFVSYGGSSLIASMMGMGLVLNAVMGKKIYTQRKVKKHSLSTSEKT